MKTNRLETIFENCLQRLQGGETLEVILADYPQEAKQLRPLLLTAANLDGLRPSTTATERKGRRAQFLAAAAARRPAPSRKVAWQPLRALVTSLVLLVVIGGSLRGTGLASAKALPGETLYPVKRAVERTRLTLTGTSLDRLRLAESFDQQRTMEVARLVENQRSEEVSFHGMLESNLDGSWQVGGLTVYSQNPAADWQNLSGAQVEVVGHTRPDGVEVQELRLRLFHLDGDLEGIGETEWLVSGVPLDLSPATRINGQAQIGAPVAITAIQLQAGRFLALSIQVGGSQVQEVKAEDQTIRLSDWAIVSADSDDEDHSGSGKDSADSSSDDAERTPEPDKTDDSD